MKEFAPLGKQILSFKSNPLLERICPPGKQISLCNIVLVMTVVKFWRYFHTYCIHFDSYFKVVHFM